MGKAIPRDEGWTQAPSAPQVTPTKRRPGRPPESEERRRSRQEEKKAEAEKKEAEKKKAEKKQAEEAQKKEEEAENLRKAMRVLANEILAKEPEKNNQLRSS